MKYREDINKFTEENFDKEEKKFKLYEENNIIYLTTNDKFFTSPYDYLNVDIISKIEDEFKVEFADLTIYYVCICGSSLFFVRYEEGDIILKCNKCNNEFSPYDY